MLDATSPERTRAVPAPLAPVTPDLGLAGIIAAVGAIVGAIARDVFTYLRDRSDGRDNATFRRDLMKQVAALSVEVGTLRNEVLTYHTKLDERDKAVADLEEAQANLTADAVLADAERARLRDRVAVLEARNRRLTETLEAHGIPLPEDE